MNIYKKYLSSTLKKGPGLLASDLVQLLIAKFGVKASYARQIIKRSVSEGDSIWSTNPLSFGHGQFYYFHPDHYPTRKAIKDLAKAARPPLYRLLDLMERCDGVICFHEGLKVTASPEEGSSTKVSRLIDMVDDLAKFNMVVQRKDESGGNYILIKNKDKDSDPETSYTEKISRHIENLQTDTLLIPDLLKWLTESNFISGIKAYRPTSAPTFGALYNNLSWDAVAYTKLVGANRQSLASESEGDRYSVVVLDVVLSREYNMNDLDGFLARIQINSQSVLDKRTPRQVIPILFYVDIDLQAYNTARTLGFIVFNVKRIYGSSTRQLISGIKEIYRKTQVVSVRTIEATLEKINESGQADLLRSLRGALFEALMKPILLNVFPNSQIFGSRKIKDSKSGKSREFDYIIVSSTPKELILVELKGYAENSYIRLGDSDTYSTLRYFFRGSIPLATNFYKEDKMLQGATVKSLFVTTGGYHSECSEFIEKMNTSKFVSSKLNFAIVDGGSLKKWLLSLGFEHEVSLINKYYIKQEDVIDNSI